LVSSENYLKLDRYNSIGKIIKVLNDGQISVTYAKCKSNIRHEDKILIQVHKVHEFTQYECDKKSFILEQYTQNKKSEFFHKLYP